MNVFIDIDIFKIDLIDIEIDINIFKTCRYIDNRYGLSIYRTPLAYRVFTLCARVANHCFSTQMESAMKICANFWTIRKKL